MGLFMERNKDIQVKGAQYSHVEQSVPIKVEPPKASETADESR
jgi:hypothetical protein